MAKVKKTLLVVVCFVLVAIIATGGTIAYLTSGPTNKSNIFTVGDIAIDLSEKVGVIGEGGTVKTNDFGATYEGVMPGDYLQKEVTVKNTGKNDAYVAVTVTLNNADLINAAIDTVYEAKYGENAPQVQEMYDTIFDGWGINYNKVDGEGNALGMRLTITGEDMPEGVMQVDSVKTIDEYWQQYNGNWFKDADTVIPFDGYYTTGMNEYELRYTYYIDLPAGESTTLFKGLNVPAEFNKEQLAMFERLIINVDAAAIQKDNMAVAAQYKNDDNGQAKTAFAILAGDIEVPEYSNKPSGTVTPGHTSETTIWGEAKTNAKKSVVIKLYSGDTYMGETSLKDKKNIIDGTTKTVTWSIALNGQSTDYWTMTWKKAPSITLQPTRVELWVDGMKVSENKVKLNNSGDDLKPVTGMVVDSNGTIIKYLFENNVPELENGESYVAVYSNKTEPFSVSGERTVVLNGVTAVAKENGQSALTINDNADVHVVIVGDTKLTGATGGNGIKVGEGATLTLSGSGSLTAIGNGGAEDTSVKNGGSGIGGEGKIVIDGLSNLVAEGYGQAGFGIGGAATDITIKNTAITYVKGGFVQQDMVNDPQYGKKEPEGGAAIGSMTDGAVITLDNVTIDEAKGGSKAAGIGARYWTAVTVNITDSTIKNVVGGNASAGIGGSRIKRGDGDNATTQTVNITIDNSTITAEGGQYGAGIGSGYDTYCHTPDLAPVCTINIKGNSTINATGGKYAAGIGTGYHAGGLAGKIEESVQVTATSGEKEYKDTYTSAMDVGFGVLDPARDGLNNTSSIMYNGQSVTVPTVQ